MTSDLGVTALIQASFGGSTEIVKLLIANDSVVNVTDYQGNTSLDLAKETLEYHTKQLTEDTDSAECNLEQKGKLLNFEKMLIDVNVECRNSQNHLTNVSSPCLDSSG